MLCQMNDQPDVIMTNGMGFKYVPSIGSGPWCTGLGLNVNEDCTLQLHNHYTPPGPHTSVGILSAAHAIAATSSGFQSETK